MTLELEEPAKPVGSWISQDMGAVVSSYAPAGTHF